MYTPKVEVDGMGRLPKGFDWEARTCGDCGKDWEALALWPEDAVCGTCSERRRGERIARINEGRPYAIDSIGGMCPTQAEGRTGQDRPFYFRARHGTWTLDVGEPDWPDYVGWPQDSWGRTQVASGDDPTSGFMEHAEVLAILDEHLPA